MIEGIADSALTLRYASRRGCGGFYADFSFADFVKGRGGIRLRCKHRRHGLEPMDADMSRGCIRAGHGRSASRQAAFQCRSLQRFKTLYLRVNDPRQSAIPAFRGCILQRKIRRIRDAFQSIIIVTMVSNNIITVVIQTGILKPDIR